MKATILILIYTGIALAASGQRMVKGVITSVTDTSGLAGVIIRTTHGEVGMSNQNGNYTVQLPLGITQMSFSSMGYITQNVTLQDTITQYNIQLVPDSIWLEEVVVSTGFQQLPKERATGSFTLINQDLFNQQVGTNILERLEAVGNGVMADNMTPGGNGRLMVRGLSTIRGPKDVLIVLDNFPYEGDINNINPNDVESVTLLKDAAAASIWGARAGNGVIVITTKKGQFNQRLAVDVNSHISMSPKPNLNYLPQMSSTDFIDVELFLYENGYYNNQINSISRPALSPVVELLTKRDEGIITDSETVTLIDAMRHHDIRDDLERYMYRPALNQQFALNVQGGSDRSAWVVSAGYDNNVSNLDASAERFNFRFQNSLRLAKGLEMNLGAYYTFNKTSSGKLGYGQIGRGYIFPYARLADEYGNALPVVFEWRQSYIDTVGGGRLHDWNYYPLEDYLHNRSNSTVNDVLVNAGLRYQLPLGLRLEMKYNYERQQTNGRRFYDLGSYAARNWINSYTQIDDDSGILTYRVPPGDVLDLSSAVLNVHNLRGQLNFDRDWGYHAIVALAGGEMREARTTDNIHRLYGLDSDILTFGSVDRTVPYPNYVTKSNSFIPNMEGLNDRVIRFLSFFGNVAYTYRQKYTLSLSARRDASNLFGVNTNNKWQPLWSAGTSWDISKEPFYHSSILPYLRLRATYGFSGNTDPTMAAVTTIQYTRNSPYTLSSTARFDNYRNPELKWETVSTFNAGLDFSLRNHRVSGSIEYYRKNGHNLFGTQPLDYTSGIGTSIVKNVARMTGFGWDVELITTNTSGQLIWKTHLNFNINKDEVKEYYRTSTLGRDFISPGISGLDGSPVYTMFSYNWGGLNGENGLPIGFIEGMPSQQYSQLTGNATRLEDLIVHGRRLPAYFGSVGNSFIWKDITLDVRVTYKAGYYFRKETINYNNLYRSWTGHSDFQSRWQKPGDENYTHVPAMPYPVPSGLDAFYAGVDVNVLRGDYISLQYINLAYNLNIKIPTMIFREVQLLANAQNIGTLWKLNKAGIDPQYGNSLVTPSTYSIGIRAKF